MFDAQIIAGATGSSTTGSTIILSPWFPREADNAHFSVDVIQSTASSFTIDVLTKNRETPGVPGSGTTFGTITIPGITTKEITGLLELVRFKYTVTDANDEWVLFRMLPFIWFDDAEVAS